MKRIVISESEKNRIINQHAGTIPIDINNVVITDWLSPDEKYVIFLDELYDLENKKKIGDIWKSPDNLILFLEHTFRVSNLKTEIKEHASKILNKVLLNENKQDFTNIKPAIKSFLVSEHWLGDAWEATKKYGGKALNYAGKFIKDTAVSTVKGVTDFGKDLVKGGYELGKAVVTGDWQEVLNLMKRGVKWLARKIRQALYSPVGIVIDTILVATGVGKVPQAVIWAIVVALDIYEFITGDYENMEDPMWLRILFFLIDILGLVSAGAAAGGARAVIKGIGSMFSLEKAVAKSALVRETLVSMIKSLQKLPAKLAELGSHLIKGHFGKLIKMALDNVGKFISWVVENLKSMFKSPALRPVLVNAGLVVGIGTGVEAYKDFAEKKHKKEEEMAKLEKEKEDKAFKELGKELINKPTDMSSQL